jgi:hypothetical protein
MEQVIPNNITYVAQNVQECARTLHHLATRGTRLGLDD